MGMIKMAEMDIYRQADTREAIATLYRFTAIATGITCGFLFHKELLPFYLHSIVD
jgi:hypothetical protein